MVEYMEGTYRRRVDGGRGEAPQAREGRSEAERRRARAIAAHACERISVDPRFVKLRRRFAIQSVLLVSSFLLCYLSYLVLSAYARDFMGIEIVDSVNVALVMGIGQFLLTFVLAWAFVRFSERAIDPLAEEIRDRAGDVGAGTAVR
ncbi:DUF485 domain-containing protein [Nocardiopsis sp. CT-R113]|uniref:DUF485 domain-containing protein n=1 Tax=Nocardiopsis codii TaxID=3065942 RepID=A0ABU7KEZ6_9ACTN|nr:DUF485 domain-containing protein [Nocardiopsis sp. CT-R113]MEE2040810.1 DUF485 domain-containing protein [Nocardiopsis sp. CT-R113]